MGVEPRYKGYPRGHLRFYGSSSNSSPWKDLVDALRNRGYEIESKEELDGLEKMHKDVPPGRDSIIYDTVVIYQGNELKRTGIWDSLISVSDANNWSVAHKNADKVRKPERRRF